MKKATSNPPTLPPASSNSTKPKALPSNSQHGGAVAGGNQQEQGFILRVINTISYKQTKLTVTKDYTIDDVQHAYAPFEAHPESYVWKDMFGRNLDRKKTLVQNGLVARDEVVEFDGIGKEPCVLLVFKDGFEDDAPSSSLNPSHRKRNEKSETLCRNY